MLFDNRSQRARKITYVPRFYNPEFDKNRVQRMSLDRFRKFSRRRRTGSRSPLVFVLLAVMVTIIIFLLKDRPTDTRGLEEINLTEDDVAVEVASSESGDTR